MSGRIPVGSAVLMTSVITAIGYGIMYGKSADSCSPQLSNSSCRRTMLKRFPALISRATVTTPTDQQFYDALAPDLKKKVDDARAAQGKALSQREKIEQIKVRSVQFPGLDGR